MHRPTLYCSRLILLFLLILTPATCFSWPAKVVSVADGDTINVLRDGRQVKVRLYGIDCPEKDQDFGQEAKDFTSSMLAGRKKVRVEPITTDQYGRTVAMVFADDINLNEQIVAQGYGWMYRTYCQESFGKII